MNATGQLIHILSLLASRGIPLGLWFLILWQFHRTVILVTAGDPAVSPYLQMVASSTRARGFAFLLGILGVVYGLWQRSLRLRAEKMLEANLAAWKQS